MRRLDRLRQQWRALLAIVTALGALALLWAVRGAPIQPAPFVRIDALSAFFGFALLGGIALAALAWPDRPALGLRTPATVALLLIAWSTTLTPVIVSAYLLLALLGRRPTTDDRPTTNDQRQGKNEHRNRSSDQSTNNGKRWTVQGVWRTTRRGLWVAPSLVAAGALTVGYGALVARGVLQYDARTAGAALDSFVFWFALLAAAIPISILVQPKQTKNREPRTENPATYHASPLHPFTPSPVHPFTDIFRFAWLYPLARLYSLGPWNTGWAFATLLLGGGAALWAALAALMQPADQRILAPRSFLALALAGLGLGSGAVFGGV
jgi:hypothetical protein